MAAEDRTTEDERPPEPPTAPASEDADVEVEREQDAPEPAELDSETRERRDAALRHVRKFGDPVLRATALPVERFDEGLAAEVERMGELMHDALGVGLAATQLGVLHRVLVYKAYADDPLTALVNPMLEWTSDELETAEEGCLSLPGVHVEVERPARVRVRGPDETRQGARDRDRGARGARDPARDRSPRRCPDPRSHLPRGAQGGDARDARGAAHRARIVRQTPPSVLGGPTP